MRSGIPLGCLDQLKPGVENISVVLTAYLISRSIWDHCKRTLFKLLKLEQNTQIPQSVSVTMTSKFPTLRVYYCYLINNNINFRSESILCVRLLKW